MNITSALLAVQDLQTLTAGIDRMALDELLAQQALVATAIDRFQSERAIMTAALIEQAHTWRSAIELVATCRPTYVEIAAMVTMAEPPSFELRVPEVFCLPTPWTRSFEPEFEDEPNQRTIVRPEVKRRIGFRS